MLNSAVVSAWLWFHVGILLVVVAYATCGNAIFPTLAARGRARLARSFFATLGLGLLISAPIIVAALFLMSRDNGVLKLAGSVMAMGLISVSLIGLAPLALHVGARGDANPHASQVGWTTIARGAALIALTWMLPFIGWFVVLPLSMACAVGCLVLAVRPAPAPALAA